MPGSLYQMGMSQKSIIPLPQRVQGFSQRPQSIDNQKLQFRTLGVLFARLAVKNAFDTASILIDLVVRQN
jgi:hypothetical protein